MSTTIAGMLTLFTRDIGLEDSFYESADNTGFTKIALGIRAVYSR